VFGVLGDVAARLSDRLRIAAFRQSRASKTGEKISWIQWVVGLVLL